MQHNNCPFMRNITLERVIRGEDVQTHGPISWRQLMVSAQGAVVFTRGSAVSSHGLILWCQLVLLAHGVAVCSLHCCNPWSHLVIS
eukprot:1161568-Pelagomonas_calceolata.AAC.2